MSKSVSLLSGKRQDAAKGSAAANVTALPFAADCHSLPRARGGEKTCFYWSIIVIPSMSISKVGAERNTDSAKAPSTIDSVSGVKVPRSLTSAL